MNSYVLDETTLAADHICCAFSDKKCAAGYYKKKEWLGNQFKQGYVFRKFDIRGKVFIEYCPAEIAWAPVSAPGYILINCFWVSGQYKGKGYGRELLQACIEDAKGKQGLAVITGTKKMPFLSDRSFFKQQGFLLADTAPPYFELWYLPFSKAAAPPRFNSCTQQPEITSSADFTVFYSDACPFTDYYVHVELKAAIEASGQTLEIIKFSSSSQAQAHVVPFTIYSLFFQGKFVTHQILSGNAFKKLILRK